MLYLVILRIVLGGSPCGCEEPDYLGLNLNDICHCEEDEEDC